MRFLHRGFLLGEMSEENNSMWGRVLKRRAYWSVGLFVKVGDIYEEILPFL